MTPDIQDEGFHEIQLNGKQLVFLFMAATVVSVVIFLCGVLVGRGVRAERMIAVDSAAANVVAEATPQQPAPIQAPPAEDPTKAAAPAPSAEELSAFGKLEKQTPPAEAPKTSAASPVAPPASAPKPIEKSSEKPTEKPADRPLATIGAASTPARETRPTPARETRSTPSEPNGQGFAVQIAALNIRSEAEAIAKRLTSKGYTAYVLTPASGTPSVFRVRVGKFPTRREAESIAAKLQKEEQFKPWVTR